MFVCVKKERGVTYVQNSQENVILFPKWKTRLEDKSLQAMKEKKYEEALENLNKLLNYHVNNHEVIIGKLICLMELGRYEEAQDYCEEVLKYKSAHYYHYVHMYLTILFQTSQYEALMEQVEYEFMNEQIPGMIRDQFQQLYDMSEKMKDDIKIEKHSEYINELNQAIKNEDHSLQWRLIENLRKMNSKPTRKIIALLENKTIHPVTKTAIFHWLQEKEMDEDVAVKKLNLASTVNPLHIPGLQSDVTMKQNIPSIFHLLKQLLYRYAYVRYPIMFPGEDIIPIAHALTYIGESYLNIHTGNNDLSDVTMHYIEEIKMCEALYLSIIEM